MMYGWDQLSSSWCRWLLSRELRLPGRCGTTPRLSLSLFGWLFLGQPHSTRGWLPITAGFGLLFLLVSLWWRWLFLDRSIQFLVPRSLKRCRKCVLSCFVITSPWFLNTFFLNTWFSFFLLFVLFSNKNLKKKIKLGDHNCITNIFFFLRLFVSITLRLMSRFLGFGERFLIFWVFSR